MDKYGLTNYVFCCWLLLLLATLAKVDIYSHPLDYYILINSFVKHFIVHHGGPEHAQNKAIKKRQ